MIWKFLAAILLVGMLITLRHLASLPDRDEMTLAPRHDRHPFPVDFTLPDLQGDYISLSKQQGKVILLNFWATWCHPCRAEMPSIDAAFKHYQSKSFLVLASAIDTQGKDTVSSFVQHHALSFPILLDPQDVVGRRLQLPGIPATYVIDKQGRIALAAFGAKDWNSPSMHRLFDALLAERNHDAS
jgi:peroxiredoxin